MNKFAEQFWEVVHLIKDRCFLPVFSVIPENDTEWTLPISKYFTDTSH